MAKRGLSHEDKRQKLMELLIDKMDFFQLRELEIIAKKEKGLNPIQVKELIQSLIDDNMVDMDKIGVSTYYWSFLSNIYLSKKKKLVIIREEENKFLKRIEEMKRVIQNTEDIMDCGARRMYFSDQIHQNGEKVKELSFKIDEIQNFDPLILDIQKKEMQLTIISANRWTDNIYSVLSWCKKEFNIEDEKLEAAFEIPQDLDYIDF